MIEDQSSETTEEDIPKLEALSLDFPVNKVKRPTKLFLIEHKWQGLNPDDPIMPGEYIDPGIVDKVSLPEISTHINSIPESFHDTAEPHTKLAQEDLFEVMESIDINILIESITGGKKSGFTLSELNTFAKRLGIPVTGLKKVGLAQRILDKIKLKSEDSIKT